MNYRVRGKGLKGVIRRLKCDIEYAGESLSRKKGRVHLEKCNQAVLECSEELLCLQLRIYVNRLYVERRDEISIASFDFASRLIKRKRMNVLSKNCVTMFVCTRVMML